MGNDPVTPSGHTEFVAVLIGTTAIKATYVWPYSFSWVDINSGNQTVSLNNGNLLFKTVFGRSVTPMAGCGQGVQTGKLLHPCALDSHTTRRREPSLYSRRFSFDILPVQV